MFQSHLSPLKVSLYIKKPFSFLMKQFIWISDVRLFTCKNPVNQIFKPFPLRRLTSFNTPTDKWYRSLLCFGFLCLTDLFPYLLYIHFFQMNTLSFPPLVRRKKLRPRHFWFFKMLSCLSFKLKAEPGRLLYKCCILKDAYIKKKHSPPPGLYHT